ncbi:MAG: alanine--tRNA ligase [Candidatus Aenigmarchaeota archaeon]|nr:alanine--tRNA ligase [Candidatus Aenigmarchaeota archaeon]
MRNMTNKLEILRIFQKEPEKYWKVELFEREGFERKQCKNCGKYFWSLTNQETCNDSSCRSYDFIGDPPTKKRMEYFEAWERIKDFFVKRGHTFLNAYPILCRWWPSLYFTDAGIVNFYRIDENGNLNFEAPANPTIMLQPCLRFNDIQNVGVNGRSYTSFLMVQQTSLFDGKSGYWKNEAIELDFEFLTKILGIPKEEIVFIEDIWLSPVAFGPSLEYHVRGLELGNTVFTQFEGTPEKYREMEVKVIDMGAGLERLTWITHGTPTSYDVVFKPIIEKLKKVIGINYDENLFLKYAKISGRINVDEIEDMISAKKKIATRLGISLEELEKNIEPLQALYSIVDHSRALLFALSDGAVISNVGGGYNLRVILRRALSLIDRFKWDINVLDIMNWHVDYLKKLFPKLEESREYVEKAIKIEMERYKKSREKMKKIVEILLKENRTPSEEELITLYDSYGINPELLVEAGLRINIPPKFYSKVTERHKGGKLKEHELKFDVSSLPPTEILYYQKPEVFEFNAKVLKVFEGNWVALDKTAFYPESGGQLHDVGEINGIKVLDVKKIRKVILHKLEEPIEEGKIVHCVVDRKRREILKKHHTATHILNAAARLILGKHVFQHSAFKGIDKARLDITHYDALSEEELEKIESLANQIVERDLIVKTEILSRQEAEQKYGFGIYQGGAVSERMLRIVSINEIDHEACGGTHCDSTGEVGFIKIIRSKRIQDGVVRIEFCSGEIALNYLKEKERILKEVAEKLGVEEEKVVEASKKLFEEWKKERKRLRK